MNDRLITLLGALAALVLLVGLIYSPRPEVNVSLPTSQERGANGYLGLKMWLDQSGAKTLSYRQRLKNLRNNPHFPLSGNVMITTLPYVAPMHTSEVRALHRWLEDGNTLLVLVGLDDSTNWSDWMLATRPTDLLDDIQTLTGLEFDALRDDDGKPVLVGDLLRGHQHTFSPMRQHPLMQNVEQLRAVSDSVTSIWAPKLQNTSTSVLRLASEDEFVTDAIWQLPKGSGNIILSASNSLLTNRMLGEAGNAQFLANILAWHLEPGGVVLFDDFHQGLSELYDPEAFFADPRLHRSIAFVLAFWLLYLLSVNSALVARIDRPANARQTDLVGAIGGFMQRKLSRSDAGLAMIHAWLQSICHVDQQPVSAETPPPWGELESTPGVDRAALHAVREAYRRLGLGERVDLKVLHNNLLVLKRNMG